MVAASDLLPSLRERAAAADGELLTFSDADALSAPPKKAFAALDTAQGPDEEEL